MSTRPGGRLGAPAACPAAEDYAGALCSSWSDQIDKIARTMTWYRCNCRGQYQALACWAITSSVSRKMLHGCCQISLAEPICLHRAEGGTWCRWLPCALRWAASRCWALNSSYVTCGQQNPSPPDRTPVLPCRSHSQHELPATGGLASLAVGAASQPDVPAFVLRTGVHIVERRLRPREHLHMDPWMAVLAVWDKPVLL